MLLLSTKRIVLLGLGGTVVAITVAACGVESVRARDYSQSCSVDSDCVLVEELEGNGDSCTIACARGVINKKDQEKYNTELEEEKGSCTEIAQPFCDISGTAVCSAGKCTLASALADAGSTDQ